MKIYPGNSKATRFTRARVRNQLGYSLDDQNIKEASRCKYFGIILRSDLDCVDQIIFRDQKAWKALLFVMRVSKKGNRNKNV